MVEAVGVMSLTSSGAGRDEEGASSIRAVMRRATTFEGQRLKD